jgi:hypothetical protein
VCLLAKNTTKTVSEIDKDIYPMRLTYIIRFFSYDSGVIGNVEEVWRKSHNFNMQILRPLPFSSYLKKRKWEILMENKNLYIISEKKNNRYYVVSLLWRSKVVYARVTPLTRTKLGEILTWKIKRMCNGNDF